MKAKDRLFEWFQKIEIANGRMDREDICFLMVQARHLIESAKSPSSYRMVAFYADWTVHSALDRSVVCYEVLKEITRVLADNFTNTRPDITREISRIIGFPILRDELRKLFTEYGLPTVIFDYQENWNSFISFLLWFIENQPIRFPNKPTGKSKLIRKEIEEIQKPHNMIVEALAIVRHKSSYHWKIAISGDKHYFIMGQVDIAESSDAFLTPPVIIK